MNNNDKPSNVIKLRAGYDIIFDNLICDCGCEYFLISVHQRAVCADCRAWMCEVVLSGEMQ